MGRKFFVVILGGFYSCSQKHDKNICYSHPSIIVEENKEGKKKKKKQKKGLSYFMAHAFKRHSNPYNVSWFALTRAVTAKILVLPTESKRLEDQALNHINK